MDRLIKAVSFSLILTAVAAQVHVVDNGYKGIVISISSFIKENPDLLTKLERYWTDASAFLLRATKYQLYFKEFIIILPQEWQQKDVNGTDVDVYQDNPDIFIDLTNAAKGNTPYVLNYDRCGNPGLSLHLTSEYILDESVTLNYGPAGKTLVHEWGHYRWGLFDEYPYPSDDKFYRNGNAWYPTGCSAQVDGQIVNKENGEECKFDLTTGKFNDSCLFKPLKQNRAISSLMYMSFIESIVEFCDDPATAPEHLKHNKLAPNQQNKICNYQSAWEVMRKHTDFTNLNTNQPLPKDTDTRPVFRYVRPRPQAQVLVLDTSSSMRGSFLTALRQAASQYVIGVLDTGSHLGIVTFSIYGSTASPLVEIKSDADRETLANKLPTHVFGGTGIGGGIQKGLEVLERGGYQQGGSLILISDGKENISPYIVDIIPLVLKRGVTVHTISIGQKADVRLAYLSKITGGRPFYFSGSKASTAFLDGFSATRNTLVTTSNVSHTILSEALTVKSTMSTNGTFYIDSTIGRETTLTFSYSQPIAVTINSPNGPYKAMQIQDYTKLNILKLVFENELTPGVWFYRVTTIASEADIVVNIQSKARNDGSDIMQVYSWISEKDDISFDVKRQFGVYTTVSRGQVSVLNANVIATVERPGAIPLSLNLVDNGIGSDIIKDDGIYSGTIIATDLTGDGRYNIKVKVVGTKNETKIAIGGSRSMDRNMNGMYQVTETEPLEDFQRTSTAGEFRIVDFNQTALDESPDRIPPARIMDLHVKSLDVDDVTATLVWTAVGGDFERGQAAKYIVYIGHEIESIIGTNISAGRLPEEHVIKGNLSAALAQGEREEYVILVEDLRTGGNNTFFLSVVAVDEMGNEGQPSNVVTLSNAKELSVPIRRVVEDNNSNSALYLAIGIGAPCLGLTVVAITIVVILLKRKTKKEDPA